jgi:hypothetical protein
LSETRFLSHSAATFCRDLMGLGGRLYRDQTVYISRAEQGRVG